MNQSIVEALGPLGEIYKIEGVTEIMVDAKDDIYYEANGKIVNSDFKLNDDEEILKIIKNIFKLVGRDVSNIKSFADCRLMDGTRFVAVFPPVAMGGYSFNLRKMPDKKLSWEELIKFKSITAEGVDLLKNIVSKWKNVLVIGNEGSGKTTILNNLIELIPENFRVVVLEKNANLLLNRKRLVRLEALDNKIESMPELIKAASLMRADCIVLDELRGEESEGMINLMRNGYSGIISMHAENVLDGLKRLEMKFLAKNYGIDINDVREIIASTVNYVVFQERLPDGQRKMSEISKVEFDNDKYKITPLYIFDKERKQFFLTCQKDKL